MPEKNEGKLEETTTPTKLKQKVGLSPEQLESRQRAHEIKVMDYLTKRGGK